MTGLPTISAYALDPSNNIWLIYFDSASGTNTVVEYASGTLVPGSYQTPVPALTVTGILTNSSIQGFAVDGAGNVFVGDQNTIYAYKAPFRTGETPATIANTFNFRPESLAVDAAGTIYASTTGAIDRYTFDGTMLTAGTPLTGPSIVAPGALLFSGSSLIELDGENRVTAPTVNTFAVGSTGTPTSSLGATLSNYGYGLTRDAAGYTYVLGYDDTQVVTVYPPYAGSGASLVPVATIVIPSNDNDGVFTDGRYLEVPTNGTVSLYPLYDPLHPYAGYRRVAQTADRR